jgi:hypothetical protein
MARLEIVHSPHSPPFQDDLNEAADEIRARQARDRRRLQHELQDASGQLSQFAIRASDDAFEAALGEMRLQTVKGSGILSVKVETKGGKK